MWVLPLKLWFYYFFPKFIIEQCFPFRSLSFGIGPICLCFQSKPSSKSTTPITAKYQCNAYCNGQKGFSFFIAAALRNETTSSGFSFLFFLSLTNSIIWTQPVLSSYRLPAFERHFWFMRLGREIASSLFFFFFFLHLAWSVKTAYPGRFLTVVKH